MEEETTAHRARTVGVLGLAYFVDQGEALAMPIMFPAIAALWGLSKTQLGWILGARNFLQTAGAPGWGYLADRFRRKTILVIGTGFWGIFTALVGLTQNYEQLLALRAVSGLGLAALLPAALALIGDRYAPEERGRAMGSLWAIGFVGIVISALILGPLAEIPEVGWRYGFIGLGLASCLTGLLIWLFVEEPVRGAAEPELAGVIDENLAVRYRINWEEYKGLLRLPSMWVMFLQGVFGSAAWVVLGGLFVDWMVDVRGMSNTDASVVFAAVVVGAAIGNVFGGWLGDVMHRLYPNVGRVALGQFSILVGVPMSYFIFTTPLSFTAFFLVALSTGFVIRWVVSGAKEPLVQAFIPPEARASAYSLLALVEGGIAATAGPLAGFLADRFGYTNALIWTISLPWLICGSAWFLFYRTIPSDAADLRAEMARRAEA